MGEELSLELGDKDPVPLPGEQRAICTPQLERVERAHSQAHFGGRSGEGTLQTLAWGGGPGLGIPAAEPGWGLGSEVGEETLSRSKGWGKRVSTEPPFFWKTPFIGGRI